MVDAQGEVIGRQDYSAYGSVVAQSGLMPSVGYAGMWQHHDSGINLTWYRGYQPAGGRWLSRDPIEESGGLNLFGYVEGNPMNAYDPSGLEACLGGIWDQESGDFGIAAAAGGYLGISKVNYSCRSNRLIKITGTQVCVGGGPMAALGASWSMAGSVYGIEDSSGLGGWSRHQMQIDFGPFGVQAPVNGDPGGSGSLGVGVGFGAAYTSCYTKLWVKQKPLQPSSCSGK